MWVYIKSEPNLWTVGFYSPNGEWNPVEDFAARGQAAKFVHWLNGGEVPDEIIGVKTTF